MARLHNSGSLLFWLRRKFWVWEESNNAIGMEEKKHTDGIRKHTPYFICGLCLSHQAPLPAHWHDIRISCS